MNFKYIHFLFEQLFITKMLEVSLIIIINGVIANYIRVVFFNETQMEDVF